MPSGQEDEDRRRRRSPSAARSMPISSPRLSTLPRPKTVRRPWMCRLMPSSRGSGRRASPAAGEPAVAGRSPRAASSSGRDEVGVDVGVLADVFGLAWWRRVLGHPPRVADADDEVGEDAAGPVVGLAGLEHLAVRGLVGEEGELGEDDAERAGDEQLVPGVAEQHEAGDGAAEREQDAANISSRSRCAACRRPEVADGVQQRRVLGRRIGLLAPGRRREDATLAGNGRRRAAHRESVPLKDLSAPNAAAGRSTEVRG